MAELSSGPVIEVSLEAGAAIEVSVEGRGPMGPMGPQGPKGEKGDTGTLFTPSVSPEGVLSWSNGGGLENPPETNIRGPQGETGEKGDAGEKGDRGDPGEVTEAELTAALAKKQDALTFDDVPAADSPNPVKSGGVYEAVKWHSNQNLLDNWYFVNPVNQRGQTEYGPGYWYPIDRWSFVDGSNGGYVRLLEDGIEIDSTRCTDQVWLTQYIERKPETGTVTASIVVDEMEYSVACPTIWGGSGYFCDVPSVGLTSASIDTFGPDEGGSLFLRLAIPQGGRVKIRAMKLEIGTKQTLAHQEGDTWVLNDPPPNPATEMLKCQRYYQVFATEALRPTEAEDFRPPMRIKPTKGTITVGEKTLYTADANL